MFIPLHDHNALNRIRLPFVNWAIIAVTVLIYAVFQSGIVIDGNKTAAFGFGMIPAVVNDIRELPAGYELIPEWASYFTYAFVHGSWMHLAGNMLFVWVFGDNVEDAVGHVKYLIFYLLCAGGGGFAHALVDANSQAPLVGASGAVAGIVAAYLMLHPHVRVWVLVLMRFPLPLKAMWVLGAWAIWQVVQVVIAADDGVAWWAHIGGLLTGAVLILIMRRRGVPLFDQAS